MASPRIFIHRSLFIYQYYGKMALRDFLLKNDNIAQHTILKGEKDGKLDICPPTLAQQNLNITDTHFQYFVEQKIDDGYVYGTLESFRNILQL